MDKSKLEDNQDQQVVAPSCDCPDEKAIRPTNSFKSSQMTRRFPHLNRRVGRAQGQSTWPKVGNSRRAQIVPRCPSSTLFFCLARHPRDQPDTMTPCPSSCVPFESSGSPVPVGTARLCRQNCPSAARIQWYGRVSELHSLALQQFDVLSESATNLFTPCLHSLYQAIGY